MTVREKKTLTLLGLILVIVLLGVGTIMVVLRLSTTQESVAPTAPESRPAAAEWIGGDSCLLSFAVAGPTPTATPSATLTPTPTVTSTPTPTPTVTNTPTPSPTLPPNVTATPTTPTTPTATPSATIATTPTTPPTATPAQLPEAGISLPTLGAIGGGVVLILLGILLAL